jgi:hypothetical protein
MDNQDSAASVVRSDALLAQAIDGIITEIGAGRCLSPGCEADEAWNNASKRAMSIARKYKAGRGLFQMCANIRVQFPARSDGKLDADVGGQSCKR